MDAKVISDMVNISLCLVALFIAVRSFDVYFYFRYQRLYILGLSMVLVSLSAATDFVASYVKVIALNTEWFSYTSQAVGFLFILLSLLQSSNTYLKGLIRLNLLVLPFLFVFLLLSPTLPGIPDPAIRALLGVPRCLLCFMIFLSYFSTFLSKPGHFNRFISLAFFLLGFGYFIIIIQNILLDPTQHYVDNLGNITSVIGLVALIAAVSWN